MERAASFWIESAHVVNPFFQRGQIMKTITRLYRKLLDYLNDSSDLTTGSHRGAPPCCSLYSGLSSGLSNGSQDNPQH